MSSNNNNKSSKNSIFRKLFPKRSTSASQTSSHDESETEDEVGKGFQKSFKTEIQLLKRQVTSMHSQLETMQNLNDIKDETIEGILKEKEKVQRELKQAVQVNRQMMVQFGERKNYSVQKKNGQEKQTKLKQTQQMSDFENKIHELENELIEKDVVINKLCEKFFGIKNSLNRKLLRCQQEHKTMVDELMTKLEEAYDDINEITEEILFYSIPANSANFLRTLSKNSQLLKENRLLNDQVRQLQDRMDEIKKDVPKETKFHLFSGQEAALKLKNYKSQINTKRMFSSKMNLAIDERLGQECVVVNESHSLPMMATRKESAGTKDVVQVKLPMSDNH